MFFLPKRNRRQTLYTCNKIVTTTKLFRFSLGSDGRDSAPGTHSTENYNCEFSVNLSILMRTLSSRLSTVSEAEFVGADAFKALYFSVNSENILRPESLSV